MPKPKNIVFFHPDLGIGGAERLIIDAAVGLQSLGHTVTIFTSHRDPSHCFDEARDGTLDVRVRGNTLFPANLLGRFAILCAIARQLHLILQIALFSNELPQLAPDVFIVDQLSAGIPLLRVLSPTARVLFYCHFPDKLLAKKGGWVKGLYRVPFDLVESWSTGCSDGIVVNSRFTQGVFREAFPRLGGREPRVVYPCVDTKGQGQGKLRVEVEREGEGKGLWEGKKVLLSINRFEEKKDVGLAIKAFAKLPEESRESARLVIAGGYDSRVAENVRYHTSLVKLAESLGLSTATADTLPSALAIPSDISVLFLRSVPNSLKETLLKNARLLIYTPKFEHFGIVPLEAMLAGVPVLAADLGGPKETVVDGITGWLRNADVPEQWMVVMHQCLSVLSDEKLQQMGENGMERVQREFSKDKMAERLDAELEEMVKQAERPVIVSKQVQFLTLAVLFGFVSFALRVLKMALKS